MSRNPNRSLRINADQLKVSWLRISAFFLPSQFPSDIYKMLPIHSGGTVSDSHWFPYQLLIFHFLLTITHLFQNENRIYSMTGYRFFRWALQILLYATDIIQRNIGHPFLFSIIRHGCANRICRMMFFTKWFQAFSSQIFFCLYLYWQNRVFAL